VAVDPRLVMVVRLTLVDEEGKVVGVTDVRLVMAVPLEGAPTRVVLVREEPEELHICTYSAIRRTQSTNIANQGMRSQRCWPSTDCRSVLTRVCDRPIAIRQLRQSTNPFSSQTAATRRMWNFGSSRSYDYV
jgi:hypothetical protein